MDRTMGEVIQRKEQFRPYSTQKDIMNDLQDTWEAVAADTASNMATIEVK